MEKSILIQKAVLPKILSVISFRQIEKLIAQECEGGWGEFDPPLDKMIKKQYPGIIEWETLDSVSIEKDSVILTNLALKYRK